MKKLLSLVLAAAMVLPVAAVGTVGASAEGLDSGGYGTLGTYTPSAGVKTNRLMFAMPGAWQNDTTKDARCGGAAGIYWWSGCDMPDDKAGGYGWPGYKTTQVQEAGVPNLWAIDVPTYGNGEEGNATQIIWNNYLDSGMETDPVKNPFYDAAQMTRDTLCRYLSRCDKDSTYDMLFRYIYVELFKKEGVAGADTINLLDADFWVKLNKLSAAYLGVDYDRLSDDEKYFQVDYILDEMEYDMTEMFGEYGKNFFNEDLVGDEIYPNEEPYGYGMAFTFDNMVYVVSLDPEKMTYSPVSGKAGFGGDFYFYYGAGEYGSWPTKELNEEMTRKLGADKVVSGNFTDETYLNSVMEDINIPTYPDYPSTDDEPVDPQDIYDAPDWNYPDNKIYFYANPEIWRNYQKITLYLYSPEDGEIITWGSKKGNMTDEGNNIWSFDLTGKGYTLDSNSNYGVIFTADWGMQTCDLILTEDNLGDIAYMTGNDVENSVDSNKRSCTAKWASGVNGNPVVITSIGNVIGDTFWKGEDGYSLLVKFLSGTEIYSIDNAVKFNGMSEANTINYVGHALGLDDYDIEMAVKESGRSFDWHGETDPVVVGDVNGDKKVDISDATILQRVFAEFDESGYYSDLTAPHIVAVCDVNGDGKVDILDVTAIQRILAEYR